MKDYIEENSCRDNNNDTKEESTIDINIELSSDYYEAFITIQCEDDEIINKEDIINELRKSNVTYGLKQDVIDEIVKNPKNVDRICIAIGERHVNGTDGKIEYYVEENKKKRPKQLENGKVDHKELNFINQVKKGDVLAKKILPIDGKDGKTVTNRIIKARPGKYVDFKKGKNVSVSDDGMFLLASEDGYIKVENGKISVIKILEINENVGVTTGNIRFNGKVVVKGNVENGYLINASEEVEIHGVVEGAEITAGTIIIHKGVHNNSRLICEGDINAKFMENCYAQVKGNIICDTIIHCNISCMGRIIANQKKGLILGGNIYARKEIIAKTIGSQIGSITRIQLGTDEKLLMDIKKTQKSIEEIKVSLDKVTQAINVLNNKKSNFPKKQIYLKKYLNTKEQYTLQLRTLQQNMKNLCCTLEALKYSKVSSDEIYPGTNIKINNSHYIVKNVLKNATLLKENGEIVIAPNLIRS
ncbi:DUF342 domain-containing protein [Paramaledivibacter caminithermalis]|uniref:Flagellar Assembly Protein A N-terminal region domain-containing protein n=1 Tax=Paramaledivibacter caminithermalis (strain DSM 15212 / CIP 107654 / DViRD3) TaxID=1121301 RepID=A0A1M6N696_PARC5|nr:FapA family protein [Paramaledivibacter caminithermalis]SHJ91228.1 hypothetical protein SAMN02745912_01591 [Paramaledivibacter caminithermalis DSM 15212]